MSAFMTAPFLSYIRLQMSSPYASNEALLQALNYSTEGMEFSEDLSTFSSLLVDDIQGNGSVSLSYLKIDVEKAPPLFSEEDIGREVKIEILGKDPVTTNVQKINAGSESSPIWIVGALYGYNPEVLPPTAPMAFIYSGISMNYLAAMILMDTETHTEEEKIIVTASFTDTGDIIIDNNEIPYESGAGYFTKDLDDSSYTITSTIDPTESETFDFTNLFSVDGEYIGIGNGGIIGEEEYASDDSIFLEVVPLENMIYGFFTNAAIPTDYSILEADALVSIPEYFTEKLEEASSLKYCLPIITDIVINEAYTVDKLDGSKWIGNFEIETNKNTCLYTDEETGKLNLAFNKNGNSDFSTSYWQDSIYGLQINKNSLASTMSGNGLTYSSSQFQVRPYQGISVDSNGVKVNNGAGLAFDSNSKLTVSTGDGLSLDSSTSKVVLNKATQTALGGIQIVADGDTLYISNDGQNPIR